VERDAQLGKGFERVAGGTAFGERSRSREGYPSYSSGGYAYGGYSYKATPTYNTNYPGTNYPGTNYPGTNTNYNTNYNSNKNYNTNNYPTNYPTHFNYGASPPAGGSSRAYNYAGGRERYRYI
jgi:hypothetical protein